MNNNTLRGIPPPDVSQRSCLIKSYESLGQPQIRECNSEKDGDTRTDLLSGSDLHYAFMFPGVGTIKIARALGPGQRTGSQSVNRGP
jgi:hypothetical protein